MVQGKLATVLRKMESLLYEGRLEEAGLLALHSVMKAKRGYVCLKIYQGDKYQAGRRLLLEAR